MPIYGRLFYRILADDNFSSEKASQSEIRAILTFLKDSSAK